MINDDSSIMEQQINEPHQRKATQIKQIVEAGSLNTTGCQRLNFDVIGHRNYAGN